MATVDRATYRAKRRASRTLTTLGSDVRDARTTAGESQVQVGRRVGMSGSKISRVEAGRLASLSIADAVLLANAVGLDLSVRTFPGARAPRDAGQLARLHVLLSHVGPPLTYRTEVPVATGGEAVPDQRAWDAVIYGGGRATAVELEVRLYDIQAQLRRLRLKWRDGAPDGVLLVVADTRANRRVLAEYADLLIGLPRLRLSTLLAGLRAGRHPATGVALI